MDSSRVAAVVDELMKQLDRWHNSLPDGLLWDRHNHSVVYQALELEANAQQFYAPSMYATEPMDEMQSTSISEFIVPNSDYPHSNDVLHALLRTRYYHLEYLLYRPFVYKVLHEPEKLVEEDFVATAKCLQACLLWPIILPPVSRNKRLIPCLYLWSQNILGVLVILHLSTKNMTLYQARNRCGPEFELQAKMTVEMGLAWIRDLKDSDRCAQWCWAILKGLYRLDA